MTAQPRIAGKFASGATALERFAAKCRFEATTGCVLWTGGTMVGSGVTTRYGSFWFDGRAWAAHRWSGIHIHGLDLSQHQAGHCCPGGPNSLCVEHISAQTQLENIIEQHDRLGNPVHRVVQSAREKQHWLFVALGIEQESPPPEIDPDAVPFHEPPAWLRPFLTVAENDDDCPF